MSRGLCARRCIDRPLRRPAVHDTTERVEIPQRLTKMEEIPGSGPGSLIVVGSGIRIVGQLTMEAIAWMKRADRLLYVVDDPVSAATIQRLNPKGAESLARYYADGKSRMVTYHEMVDRILEC